MRLAMSPRSRCRPGLPGVDAFAPADAALVRHSAPTCTCRRGRQDDVGDRRPGEKTSHDQVIEPKQLPCAWRRPTGRARRRRRAWKLALVHRLNICSVPVEGRIVAPGLLELVGPHVALDVRKPGSLFKIAPMSPPPDVVQPRSGFTSAVATDVAGEEREADERRRCRLRCGAPDAERPADDRPVGARTRGGVADHLMGRRSRARLLASTADRGGVLVESGRRTLDELAVVEAGMQDLARHRVGEGDVGADVDAEPGVRPPG